HLMVTPGSGENDRIMQIKVITWPGRYGNDGLNCTWKPTSFIVDGVEVATPDVSGDMGDIPNWAVQGGSGRGDVYLARVDPAKVPSRIVNVELTLDLSVTPTHV